jgi:S1-C subfamily serine protease
LIVLRASFFALALPILFSCTGYQKKFKFPRESFVYLKQLVTIKKCKKGKPFECKNFTSGISGSGSIVKRIKNGSYILTAAHVCENEKLAKIVKTGKLLETNFHAIDIGGKSYPLFVLSTNASADLCLLFAEGMLDHPVIKLANRSPRPGEKVYNMAAPKGVFTINMFPLFSGYYAGHDKSYDLYTIPATQGSSGSPVLNSDSRLIGVVTMSFTGFQSMSLSPPYNSLRAFLLSHL